MISVLLSCSSQENAIRTALARAPATPRISFDQPQAAVKRLTANPMLLLPAPAFAAFARVVSSFDEGRCRALASELAASTSWQVPTLVRLQAMDIGNSAAFQASPGNRDVPAATRQLWLDVGQDFDTKVAPANKGTLRNLFALQLRLAKLFDDAGVKMMTGTDFGGQWLAPGASLHQEFDLLARAGISPLHIRQRTSTGCAPSFGVAGSTRALTWMASCTARVAPSRPGHHRPPKNSRRSTTIDQRLGPLNPTLSTFRSGMTATLPAD